MPAVVWGTVGRARDELAALYDVMWRERLKWFRGLAVTWISTSISRAIAASTVARTMFSGSTQALNLVHALEVTIYVLEPDRRRGAWDLLVPASFEARRLCQRCLRCNLIQCRHLRSAEVYTRLIVSESSHHRSRIDGVDVDKFTERFRLGRSPLWMTIFDMRDPGLQPGNRLSLPSTWRAVQHDWRRRGAARTSMFFYRYLPRDAARLLAQQVCCSANVLAMQLASATAQKQSRSVAGRRSHFYPPPMLQICSVLLFLEAS